MKRFSVLALMFFTIFSCFIFSACGNKYKKLEITSNLDEIRLIIDEDKTGNDDKSVIDNLEITFKGIESKDVGQIEIYSIPAEVVNISDVLVNGNKCTAKITAVSPIKKEDGVENKESSAKLVVKHLASEKTLEIPLVVDKKAKSAVSLNKTVTIAIPDGEEVNKFKFNPGDIIKTTPIDATDNVEFKLLEKGDYAGVSIVNNTVEISNSTTNGITFYVYPTLKMKDYEDLELKNVEICVKVLKQLNSEKLVCYSPTHGVYSEKYKDVDVKDTIVGDEGITLLCNDISSKYTYNEKTYSHNTAIIDVRTLENINNSVAFSDVYSLYDVSVSASTNLIEISKDEDNYVITGLDYSPVDEYVLFSYTLKNTVGDLKNFDYKVKVKLAQSLKDFKVSLGKDTLQFSINENGEYAYADLYDVYANPLGTKLGFVGLESVALSEFKNYKIEMDKTLLYVGNNDENKVIFTGSDFNSIAKIIEINNNKYQFIIYKNDAMLKFYIQENSLISENISQYDNIRIKYKTNDNYTDTSSLKLKVSNTFATSNKKEFTLAEKDYQNIFIKKEIEFNKQVGVSKILANMYTLEDKNASVDETEIGNAPKFSSELSLANAPTIYLANSQVNKENADKNKKYYGFKIGSLLNAEGKQISDVKIKYTLTKMTTNDNNNLQLCRWNDNKAFDEGLESFESNQTGFVGLLGEGLVYGKYLLTISQEATDRNLYAYIIVFKDNDEVRNDFLNDVSLNGDFIQNAQIAEEKEPNKTYYTKDVNGNFNEFNGEFENNVNYYTAIYEGYKIGAYIVSAGTTLTLRYNIKNAEYCLLNNKGDYENKNHTGISIGYNYENSILTEGLYSYLGKNEGEYYSNLEFRKGTYKNGVQYIRATIKLALNNFDDKTLNVVESTDDPLTIEMVFYIYEPVKSAYFIDSSNAEANVIKYYSYIKSKDENDKDVMYNNIGYNFADYAKETVSLKVVSANNIGSGANIVNYVTDIDWQGFDFDKKTTPLAGVNLKDYNKISGTNLVESCNLSFYLYENDGTVAEIVGSIYVTIKQFNKTLPSIRCEYRILTYNRTETVEIENSLGTYSNGEKYLYINKNNISNNNEIKISAKNKSSAGEVKFKGFEYVITDMLGNQKDDIIRVSDDGTITPLSAGKVYVYVIALDSLATSISNDDIINENFLKDKNLIYTRFIVNIADGSMDNPYYLSTKDDITKIQKDKNYLLINDINMGDTEVSIDEFFGTIDSFESQILNIYNLKLTKPFIKTLKSGAKIKNIAFSLKIDNINVDTFGLIGENYGLVENCTVNLSSVGSEGKAVALNENELVFGGLVGINYNQILYTKIVQGVIGEFSLDAKIDDKKKKPIKFGGLVGINNGTIKGYEYSASSDGVNYNTYFNFENALYNGNFTITNYSADNNSGFVGGVVGFNNKGVIENAYAVGTLTAESNVGGIIGKNLQDAQNVSFGYTDRISINNEIEKLVCYVKNSYSSVKVKGINNVGGITGLDIGGRYYGVKYEVYSGDDSAVITGENNVGGLIGNSTSTRLLYSYFNSFRDLSNPDVTGEQNVGGLIGYSVGHEFDNNNISALLDGSDFSVIYNSSSKANVKANEFAGGVIGYSKDFNFMQYGYFYGQVSSKLSNDCGLLINTFAKELGGNREYSQYEGDTYLNKVYSYLNNVYSYDISNTDEKAYGDINISDRFKTDNNINNGKPYLLDAKKNSLVSIVPTSINVANAFINKNEPITVSGKKIGYRLDDSSGNVRLVLYYYNLIDNTNNLVQDRKTINTVQIDNIIDRNSIKVSPENANKNLMLKSSNESVFTVLDNGNLLLRSEGEAYLYISSILNPNAKAEVKIFVRTPVNSYDINATADKLISLDNSSINIVAGESKIIYENYASEIIVNNYLYSYTEPTSVSTVISCEDENVGEYLTISFKGQEYKFKDEIREITLIGRDAIIISVNKYDPNNNSFKLTLHSYLYVDGNQIDTEIKKSFTVNTKKGASKINSNISGATISPSDELNLILDIDTDTKIEEITVNELVKDFSGNIVDNVDYGNGENRFVDILNSNFESAFKKDTNNKFTNKISLLNDVKNNVQIENFVLKINPEISITQKYIVELTLSIHNVSTKIILTLIPQPISSIKITNYETVSNDSTESNVIRPGTSNYLVLNVAPLNAYYDYLEITDTFENEKILFQQVDGVKGNPLRYMDTVSSDGYGIKLTKDSKNPSTIKDNENPSTLYVKALLNNLANISSYHRLKITAYLNSGEQVYTQYKSLQVVLNPSLILDYIDPLDNIAEYDSRKEIAEVRSNWAVLTEMKFALKMINVDETTLECSLTLKDNAGNVISTININELFEIQKDVDNYYYLKFNSAGLGPDGINELIDELLGKTLVVEFKASNEIRGITKEVSATIEFDIQRYVVHGISLTHTTNANVLYGSVGVDTPIEFYFGAKDISFYNNGSFWDRIYKYENVVNAKSDSPEESIKNLLEAFNTGNNNISLYYKNESNKLTIQTSTDNQRIIATDDFTLTYKQKDGLPYVEINAKNRILDEKLFVKTHIKYENNLPIISKEDANLSSSWAMRFTPVTDIIETEKIYTEEDFKNMLPNGYYQLESDLTFENYVPFQEQIASFNGNGHTITIKSFDLKTIASESDGDGYFGLFKEIYAYEDTKSYMIVENLTVKYEIKEEENLSSEALSTNNNENQYYENVYFGGISAISNGIITNCKLEGTINLISSKSDIDKFYFGGLTATNNGYITNSYVSANITTKAVFGGLTAINKHKISSCGFTGSITTNVNVENASYGCTAGFVYQNEGEISLSFVGDVSASLALVKSSNSVAGFVYENVGNIVDSFVANCDLESSGYIGGFVFNNRGSINECYSNINISKTNRGYRYFVQTSSGEMENCFYVASSTKQGELVKYIDSVNKINEKEFEGFLFASTGYGNWIMTPNGPKLNHENWAVGEYYPIYDKVSFNAYFGDGNPEIISNTVYGKYRLVADVDLSMLTDRPKTMNLVFSGQLNGNNMSINNFSLYSGEETEAVGLFKSLLQNNEQTSYVKNLVLKCNSVRASNTESVGVLAGVIDSSFVYNITIDSENLSLVGKNAVGGLSGMIIGSFDVGNIKSNVSANSTYRYLVANSSYNPYLGFAFYKTKESNLKEVSYVGSVAGIVDGYGASITSNQRYNVSNITVEGNITLIGETVGSAFGFVGEKVSVNNLYYNLGTGTVFKGVYYSGGLVGENRGTIVNAQIVDENENRDAFYGYAKVCGGVVANNYGIINSASSSVYLINDINSTTTGGGIVGRNVEGIVDNCSVVGGKVVSLFAGGIIGTNYKLEQLKNPGNSSGKINTSLLNNFVSILSTMQKDTSILTDKNNVSYLTNGHLSGEFVKNSLDSIATYYTINPTYNVDNKDDLFDTVNAVFGLLIGYNFEEYKAELTINDDMSIDFKSVSEISLCTYEVDNAKFDDIAFTKTFSSLSGNKLLFLYGYSNEGAMDMWATTTRLTGYRVLFTNKSATKVNKGE